MDSRGLTRTANCIAYCKIELLYHCESKQDKEGTDTRIPRPGMSPVRLYIASDSEQFTRGVVLLPS